MRDKDFNFGFTKDVDEFMIFRGDIRKVRGPASFAKLTWIYEEQIQSSKLLEPKRFDAHKNTVAPIIVMLGYLGIYIEVSDVDM